MRSQRGPLAALVCLLVVLSTGVAVTPAGATPGEPDSVAPPDPDEDVQGWEDGYWHNDTLDVDQSDGVTEAELEAIVSRSMARVEYVRGVEFDRRPPVQVINRSELADLYAELYANANVSEAARTHQNVKFEALFFVGEETDYLEVQERNRAEGVLGFYVFGNASGFGGVEGGDIVLVSDGEGPPRVDEITLAQELFHSYQDQQLRTTNDYEITTEDDQRAVLSVVEGDGNYVDYLYEQRCGDEWNCLQPDRDRGSTDRHIGLAVYGLVPYSDGPPFVQDVRQEGDWSAVADLYDRPPETTEQYIHPEKYRKDAPANVTVADRSSDAWRILELETGVNYATFGEAGVYTMLWYPSYLTRSNEVVPYNHLFDGGPPPDLYSYDHPYSAGWDGDKLYPYVSDSAAANETGYVWKLAWDSPADAEQFADGYRQLLAFHGAREVQGAEGVYVVLESDTARDFADTFSIEVDGDRVTIVNAPTVADLNGVREGTVPPGVSTPTATPTATPFEFGTATPTSTGTETGTSSPTPVNGTTSTPGQPGFGAVTALVAAVVAAFAVVVRRR
jgi:PGF-CTERM protein